MADSIWFSAGAALILLALFAIGVSFLIKYRKTKAKKFLWAGIALTFGAGILTYLYYSYLIRPSSEPQIMCYKVAAVDLPQNLSPAFMAYKKGLLKKIKPKVSDNVFRKLSGRKD